MRGQACARVVQTPSHGVAKIYILPSFSFSLKPALVNRAPAGHSSATPAGELPMKFPRSIWKIVLAAYVAAPLAQAKAQGPASDLATVRGVVSDSATQQPVVGAQ